MVMSTNLITEGAGDAWIFVPNDADWVFVPPDDASEIASKKQIVQERISRFAECMKKNLQLADPYAEDPAIQVFRQLSGLRKQLNFGNNITIPTFYRYDGEDFISHIFQEITTQKKLISDTIQRLEQEQKRITVLRETAQGMSALLVQRLSEFEQGTNVEIPAYCQHANAPSEGDVLIANYLAVSDPQFAKYMKESSTKYFLGNICSPLLIENTRIITQLWPRTFQKVMAFAYQEIVRNGTTEHTIDGQRFILNIEQRKIKVIQVESPLGNGSYGCVSKVLSVTEGIFFALKENLLGKDDAETKLIRDSLLKENLVLERIHKHLKSLGETSEGFQLPPVEVFHLHSGKVGLMGPLYDIDLFRWLRQPHSLKERILFCKQLMRAFGKLVLKLEYQLYEIKPTNVLVKGDRVVFSDLSSASPFPVAGRVGNDFNLNIHTHNFNNLRDHQHQEEAALNGNISAFRQIAISRMLFSLGFTFFQVISAGSYPYSGFIAPAPNIPSDYPNTQNRFEVELLTNRRCSPSLVNLIRDMVTHEYEQRMSVEDAMRYWELALVPPDDVLYN